MTDRGDPEELSRWFVPMGDARKRGGLAWLEALPHPGEQPRARLILVEADQVEVDHLAEQTARVALGDPYGHESPARAGGIVGERAPPLRLREGGSEVARREHGDRPPRLLRRSVNLDDEVRTGDKIPGLQYRRVARVLELPSDPLGPGIVGAVVGDEEVPLQ